MDFERPRDGVQDNEQPANTGRWAVLWQGDRSASWSGKGGVDGGAGLQTSATRQPNRTAQMKRAERQGRVETVEMSAGMGVCWREGEGDALVLAEPQ
jgi:hypothetical protein